MKKISLIIFSIYTVFLVLFITFGSSAAAPIYAMMSKFIKKTEYNIRNIEFDLNDNYLIEKEYFLNYTVLPNKNVDYEIKFESLDPDIFTVDEKGYIYGKRTTSDNTVGRLRITSNKDLNFEKIITLNFKKSYPTDIKVHLDSFYKKEEDIYTTYLNFPINFSYSNIPNTEITETKPIIEFDESIFKKNSDYSLTPTTLTDETIVYLKQKDVVKEIKIKVINMNDDLEMMEKNSSFNKIEFYQSGNNNNKDFIYYTSSNISLRLLNDDFAIIVPYTVTSANEEILKVANNYLIPQKAGIVDIMISLENGFNQTYTLILKNKLVSPKLEGLEIKNGACDILIGEKSLINFVFPNDAKYKQISVIYDNSCLTLTKTSELQYQLEGIKASSSVIKVIVDDGENKIETTYTINVNENKKVLFFVKSNLSTIVPKIMGHLVLFIVEGILALWVTLYYHSNKKVLSVVLFMALGLFLGSLTEVMQLFIPGRSGKIADVIVDFIGYLLGASLLWLVYIIFKNHKKHHLHE